MCMWRYKHSGIRAHRHTVCGHTGIQHAGIRACGMHVGRRHRRTGSKIASSGAGQFREPGSSSDFFRHIICGISEDLDVFFRHISLWKVCGESWRFAETTNHCGFYLDVEIETKQHNISQGFNLHVEIEARQHNMLQGFLSRARILIFFWHRLHGYLA